MRIILGVLLMLWVGVSHAQTSQNIHAYTGFSVEERPYLATGNGTTDDTVSIQLALNAAAAQTFGSVSLVNGHSYKVSSTLIVPYNVTLTCPGSATIVPSAGGTFLNNYLFYLNTNSSNYPNWTTSYVNVTGKVENFNIDNTVNSVSGLKGFYCASSCFISQIRTFNLTAFFIRDSSDYIDLVKLEKIEVGDVPSGSATYQIQIGNVGDGLSINQCSCWANDGNGVKFMAVTNCAGGNISNCINGTLQLTNCRAFKVNGFHAEHGQILLNSSDVSLDSIFMYMNNGGIILTKTNSGNDLNHYNFSNISFMNEIDWTTSGTSYGVNSAEIKTDSGILLNLNNCHRVTSGISTPGKSADHGISIIDASGNPVTAFNNYSYVYSTNCTLEGLVPINPISVNCAPPSKTFSVSASGSPAVWQLSSNTYYYTVQYLFDQARLIGKATGSSEGSQALTLNGNGALIVLSSTDNPAIVRVYRGTSTGSYDHYVDVQCSNAKLLYDNGQAIAGTAWVSRGAAGVTAINTNVNSLTVSPNYYSEVGSALPTHGAYTTNDVLWSPPSSGVTTLFGCSAGGSPGTWLSNGITWR